MSKRNIELQEKHVLEKGLACIQSACTKIIIEYAKELR